MDAFQATKDAVHRPRGYAGTTEPMLEDLTVLALLRAGPGGYYYYGAERRGAERM